MFVHCAILHLLEVASLRQAACGSFFLHSNQLSEHCAEDDGQDGRSLLRLTDIYPVINICIFVSDLTLHAKLRPYCLHLPGNYIII